jgi:hypothetical protein
MYKVEKIFTEQQLEEVKSLYHTCKPWSRFAHQDYNLFDVEKRIVPHEHVDLLNKVLENYTGLEMYSHYFLKYEEGSFTRCHTDNVDDVSLTVVTLIDEENLIGGEALAFETYEKRSRPANKYAKRKNEDAPVGQEIIPVVIPCQVGDSIVYGKELRHGVAQVHSGSRLVLISWFK